MQGWRDKTPSGFPGNGKSRSSSEIPCRVSNIARGGGDTVSINRLKSVEPHRHPCRVSRAIPRVRTSRLVFPVTTQGVRIPGCALAEGAHNTPALILAYESQFLYFRLRGWRRLFLRFISTEQATSLRLGSQAEFLGQSERRKSRAARSHEEIMELRVHSTGSI